MHTIFQKHALAYHVLIVDTRYMGVANYLCHSEHVHNINIVNKMVSYHDCATEQVCLYYLKLR